MLTPETTVQNAVNTTYEVELEKDPSLALVAAAALHWAQIEEQQMRGDDSDMIMDVWDQHAKDPAFSAILADEDVGVETKRVCLRYLRFIDLFPQIVQLAQTPPDPDTQATAA